MITYSNRSPIQKTQSSVMSVLKPLEHIPKVKVTRSVNEDGDITNIYINCSQEYVPDYEFVWCPHKGHYRVYIKIASVHTTKMDVGYCICVIPNGFAASAFCVMYGFIHKYRANNKLAAI